MTQARNYTRRTQPTSENIFHTIYVIQPSNRASERGGGWSAWVAEGFILSIGAAAAQRAVVGWSTFSVRSGVEANISRVPTVDFSTTNILSARDL